MRPPPFKIEQRVEHDRYRLAVSGELDIATAPDLARSIATLCQAGAIRIVIDLQAVSFIDSTGLRAIMLAKDRCAEHRTEFFVVPSRHPGPKRLFEIVGAEGTIPWQNADTDEPLRA